MRYYRSRLTIRITTIACSLLALLLLSGCNGGSGGIDNPFGDATSNPSATTQSAVNGRLKGLYFSSKNGDWLNLDTGETGSVYSSAFDRGVEAIVPSSDGLEYLQLHVDDPAFGETTSTVLIKDTRTGLINDEFTVKGEISGYLSIRLSPDRQIVSVRWDEHDNDEEAISFFTRKGEYINKFRDDSVYVYDWMPDGRFVYVKNDVINIGRLEGTAIQGDPIVSIEHLTGYPQRIKSSPDSNHFVFEMVTETPSWLTGSYYRNSTVWRVAADGSGLAQVATMALDDFGDNITEGPRVNNPLWSLDGSQLLMSVGVFSNVTNIWDDSNNPAYIEETFIARQSGYMYALDSNSSDINFLSAQDPGHQTIAYHNGESTVPYAVPSTHIEPEAMLVAAVPPLEEVVGQVPDRIAGALIYLKDDYGDEFDDRLIVAYHDLATGSETVLFQKEGRDFDDDYLFAISSDRTLFSHFYEKSYDDKYLKIYDSQGNELKSFQLLHEDYPDTVGKNLLMPATFSPANSDLLLIRARDESDDKLKLGVLDWKTGNYIMLLTGEFRSATWEENGSILVAVGKDIYRYAFTNGSFSEPVRLFSLPNAPSYLDASADGTRLLFTMAGHIFWSSMDGSSLTQVTAPSIDTEYRPVWSPDAAYITFMKDDTRYVISSASNNLRIYNDTSRNSYRAREIGSDGSVVYWQP